VCDPRTTSSADGIRPPEEGSIIVIVATDAPLTPDQLKRLARRVPLGLGRAGSIEGDESGDIFLAFSTANAGADEGNSSQNYSPLKTANVQRLASWYLDPIFEAVAQATEESIDNALIAAKTMTGADYWVVPALPHDQLQEVLRKHNVLKQ
jgi:L-aminopeptidase/D-esterase-like protein